MKSKIFLIGLVLTIALYGCVKPSEQEIANAIESTKFAEQTSTPRATNTPIVTEMSSSIEEEQHEEWETVFYETFDDNSYQWGVGVDSEFGTESIVSNGKYIINYNSANQTGYSTGFSLAIPFAESKDYVVSILGEMDSVFKQNTWGIMVNGFFDTGISFEIDNQGNFFITDGNIPGDTYIGNGKRGSHNVIKWDGPNSITVVADDELLTFLVNGTVITSYEYKYSNKNDISISLWAAEGVSVVYEFDHILVREK